MLHVIAAALDGFVSDLQTWLYVDIVQPLLFKVGLMDYDEDTYDALYWVIVGALQVVAMYVLLRPLEALRPVERWESRREARVDVIYTLIAKLGIFSLFFFFAMQPLFDSVQYGCACTGSRTSISITCGRASPPGRSSRSRSI